MISRIAWFVVVVMGILILGAAEVAWYQDEIHDRSSIDARAARGENIGYWHGAMDLEESAPIASSPDVTGLDRIGVMLQQRISEFDPANRVPEDQLSSISAYVVHDTEQSGEWISAKFLAILLVIIVALLML